MRAWSDLFMATPGVTFGYNTNNECAYAGQASYGCLGLATDMVDGKGCLFCIRIPGGATGGRACMSPHQYYTQPNTAFPLFMGSAVSPGSTCHDTGPTTSYQ